MDHWNKVQNFLELQLEFTKTWPVKKIAKNEFFLVQVQVHAFAKGPEYLRKFVNSQLSHKKVYHFLTCDD
jgi:hypothetical protein